MNRYQRRSNPLSGIEPGTWQSDASQPRTEPAEIPFDWDPQSRSNVMARRAANEVRRIYRIEQGDVVRLAKHDREVKQIWEQMMDGTYKPPASAIAPQVKRDPATDPRSPRNWSRMKYGG